MPAANGEPWIGVSVPVVVFTEKTVTSFENRLGTNAKAPLGANSIARGPHGAALQPTDCFAMVVSAPVFASTE